MVEDLPRYLRNGGKGKDEELMARFRCGNFEEANKYWMKVEERYCSICKGALGSWEHLVKDCEIMKRDYEDWMSGIWKWYENMAYEGGEREATEIMKKITKMREGRVEGG